MLIYMLSMASVCANAQTLTPNTFSISQAKKGVPMSFDAVYTNTRNEQITLTAGYRTGYEPIGEYRWSVKGDTNWIGTILVEPDQQIDLVLTIIEKKDSLTDYYGALKQIDAEGAEYYVKYDMYNATPPAWPVSIETPWIDLGALPRESDTANIILRNHASDSAKVYMRVRPDAPFYILSKYKIIAIAPNASATIPVVLTPTAEGRVYQTISFSRNDNVSHVQGNVTLFGSTRAGDTAGVVAPTPIIVIEDVVVGGSATQDIQFTTTHAETYIVDISLRQGTNLFLEPHQLPLPITPATPLIVRVRYQPTTAGTVADTIVVTSANGSVATSILRINAVASSVNDDNRTNNVHPNPSSGLVSWSGHPLSSWHIMNSVGEHIATITSSEQGACSWSTSTSGMYTIVSQRGEPAMRVIIAK